MVKKLNFNPQTPYKHQIKYKTHMKARFYYGDGKKDYITLNAPEYLYHLYKLIDMTWGLKGKDKETHDDAYHFLMEKALVLYLSEAKGLTQDDVLYGGWNCEMAEPTRGCKLAFDIIKSPIIEEDRSMKGLYDTMINDGIPTDGMGRIYLSEGMVITRDGTIEEE